MGNKQADKAKAEAEAKAKAEAEAKAKAEAEAKAKAMAKMVVPTWEFRLVMPATYRYRGVEYKRGKVYTTTSKKLVESLPGVFVVRKVKPPKAEENKEV